MNGMKSLRHPAQFVTDTCVTRGISSTSCWKGVMQTTRSRLIDPELRILYHTDTAQMAFRGCMPANIRILYRTNI